MTTLDDFLTTFRHTHSRMSRLYARVMSRADLSLPQYALLNLLSSRDVISMTEVSCALGITKPAVTNLVDRLEQRGFLRRIAHPKDRRISLLHILPKGRSVVKSVESSTLGLCTRAARRLSGRDLETMMRFHALLHEAIDQELSEVRKR